MPKEKVFVMPKNRKELLTLLVNRINNGVKFLDKQFGRGKWIKRVVLTELDLEDRDMCICGQAFSDKVGTWYGKGADRDLVSDGFEYAEHVLTHDRLNQYGFNLEDELTATDAFPHAFDLLTALWIAKLSKLMK